MNENKKNAIMIGIAVVCLALAGAITYSHFFGNDISRKDMEDYNKVWMKCSNAACNAEYQIDRDIYLMSLQTTKTPQPLICEKCKKPSAYGAVKCKKCEQVFFYNTFPDLPDKCPNCGYSPTEKFQNHK